MTHSYLPKNRIGRVPIRKVDDPRRRRKPYELSVFIQGKRKRNYYCSHEEALKAWKQYKRMENRYGNAALEYSKDDHIEYCQAKELANYEVSLVEAVKFWRKHHKQLQKVPIVQEVVPAFINNKEQLGRSSSHIIKLKSYLKVFCKTFGHKRVNLITGNQLLRWLLDLPYEPNTIHGYHSTLSNFFNWCKRRQWLEMCPTDDINKKNDLPTIPNPPKGILSVDQTVAMFRWLESHHVQYVPWYALQAFAGIRVAEAERFDWSWLDFERKRIILPGWIFSADAAPKQGTKTQDSWVMQGLPDNLWRWLEHYRQPEGPIVHPGTNILVSTLRKGFTQMPDHPIDPWPSNALRHTFCTMHISLYESAEKTAFLLRHRNTRLLYQHYLAKIVPVSEAQRYFNILPGGK